MSSASTNPFASPEDPDAFQNPRDDPSLQPTVLAKSYRSTLDGRIKNKVMSYKGYIASGNEPFARAIWDSYRQGCFSTDVNLNKIDQNRSSGLSQSEIEHYAQIEIDKVTKDMSDSYSDQLKFSGKVLTLEQSAEFDRIRDRMETDHKEKKVPRGYFCFIKADEDDAEGKNKSPSASGTSEPRKPEAVTMFCQNIFPDDRLQARAGFSDYMQSFNTLYKKAHPKHAEYHSVLKAKEAARKNKCDIEFLSLSKGLADSLPFMEKWQTLLGEDHPEPEVVRGQAPRGTEDPFDEESWAAWKDA